MNDFVDLLGYSLLRVLAFTANRFPLGMALGVGKWVGRVAFYLTPRRYHAYADFKAALGNSMSEKERWKIIRKSFEHFGMMFAETLRISSFDHQAIRQYCHFDDVEKWRDPFNKAEPVVFLTAHLGNWELLQIISGYLGRPIHVLAQPQKHKRMDEFLNRQREACGATEAVSQGMGVRGLFKVLFRKGMIGILGDRTAGKQEGRILSFLGRKTTFPTGAFELARRTKARVIPCFAIRRKGHAYDLFMEPSISYGETDEDLKEALQCYVTYLEKYIRQYPEQWHWFGKRWKYTWTKRLLILSDGKPGHVKQSEAVAKNFQKLQDQYDRPGMEYPTETIEVKFKSKAHQILFYLLAPFYIPFAHGRLRWMSGFFEKSCFEKIMHSSADFVISAGASLVPLNLCLAGDFKGKSVVLMNPGFPYHFFKFDLVIVPAHDRGWIARPAYRPVLAPNPVEPGKLEADGALLRKSLRDSFRIKIGLFLGGNTRGFRLGIGAVEYLFSELERLSKRYGDYLLTTSRRTPSAVVEYLKNRVMHDPSCQLFCDAQKDTRPEVAGGMMALAEILIVTEDSISMISEAVAAGKKVIVITFETTEIPEKHRRFQKLLEAKKAVLLCRPQELGKTVEKALSGLSQDFFRMETQDLREKLRQIL